MLRNAIKKVFTSVCLSRRSSRVSSNRRVQRHGVVLQFGVLRDRNDDIMYKDPTILLVPPANLLQGAVRGSKARPNPSRGFGQIVCCEQVSDRHTATSSSCCFSRMFEKKIHYYTAVCFGLNTGVTKKDVMATRYTNPPSLLPPFAPLLSL